jgi:hypothetical protein
VLLGRGQRTSSTDRGREVVGSQVVALAAQRSTDRAARTGTALTEGPRCTRAQARVVLHRGQELTERRVPCRPCRRTPPGADPPGQDGGREPDVAATSATAAAGVVS